MNARRQPVHEPAGCVVEAILVATIIVTGIVCITGLWWGIGVVTVLLAFGGLQLWADHRTQQRHASAGRHPSRHLHPVTDCDNVHLLRPDDRDGAA